MEAWQFEIERLPQFGERYSTFATKARQQLSAQRVAERLEHEIRILFKCPFRVGAFLLQSCLVQRRRPFLAASFPFAHALGAPRIPILHDIVKYRDEGRQAQCPCVKKSDPHSLRREGPLSLSWVFYPSV